MLLPDKHIKLAESILGLSGYIYSFLKEPKRIESLWDELLESSISRKIPAKHSFENLILAVDFLFALGVIKEDEEGRLTRCD